MPTSKADRKDAFKEHFDFFVQAVRDRRVASVVPTNAHTARRICSRIDSSRPVVVVEYGPGTGAITRQLLKHLHPGSTLIAIELNEQFANRLGRHEWAQAKEGPRLVVVRGDACDVSETLRRHGFENADFIVSGIPFSLMPKELRSTLVDRTFDALTSDGCFVVYQFTFHLRRLLRERFEHLNCRRHFANFPPLCLMEAKKSAPGVPVVRLPAHALNGVNGLNGHTR